MALLICATACQSRTVGESDVQMTWSENNAMYTVLNDVRKQARKQYVEIGYVGTSTVLHLLHSRDPEIRQLLNQDQWDAYNDGEREYYATRIVISIRNSPISYVSRGPHTGGLMGYSAQNPNAGNVN